MGKVTQILKYGILTGHIMEAANSREDKGLVFGPVISPWERGERKERRERKRERRKTELLPRKHQSFQVWRPALPKGTKGFSKGPLQ